jgi:hypothetical protein
MFASFQAKAPAPKAAPTAAVEAEVVPVVTMTVEQKAEAIRNEVIFGLAALVPECCS